MKMITIGSFPSSDIVVKDSSGLWKCYIKMDNEGNLYIADSQYKRIVFVNDQQVRDEFIPIKSTDIIRVGPTTLSYRSFLDAFLDKEGMNSPDVFPPRSTAMCYCMPSDPERKAKEREKQHQKDKLLQLNPKLEGQVVGVNFEFKINYTIEDLKTLISSIGHNLMLPQEEKASSFSESTEAKIVFDGDKFEIFDHSYGRVMTINDARIKDNNKQLFQSCELKNGDVIKIRNAVFTFRCDKPKTKLDEIKQFFSV